jgi:hypothetical protein
MGSSNIQSPNSNLPTAQGFGQAGHEEIPFFWNFSHRLVKVACPAPYCWEQGLGYGVLKLIKTLSRKPNWDKNSSAY